ncbi:MULTISPECIES: BlaI/MecI/CopY family transcriptional regulator [unclassified Pseudonocardia]|uniref:BlaI/MecI/CopY family transcriptional regulator n=1 Tax=unclassified Pseudonocardia TaxID=2619320 RepID=UPI001ACB2C46|nr:MULTISPECIES: BlaI/MecI/CopY family transcriptional regulator [unclassified Pseudonocardia]MBN9096695.1 BlaI/MecI/CopY family transcriptional regulator [Pseudonocardia sp.]
MSRLGSLERAVMETLWCAGRPLTARQVRDALPTPDLATTTVLTVLHRLGGKGLVGRERHGRGYLYQAVGTFPWPWTPSRTGYNPSMTTGPRARRDVATALGYLPSRALRFALDGHRDGDDITALLSQQRGSSRSSCSIRCQSFVTASPSSRVRVRGA